MPTALARMAVSVLFALAFAQTPAATARIAGMVVDDATGQPLKGVLVRLAVDGRVIGAAAITDTAGGFSFDATPAGRVVLTATRSGYARPRWKPGQPPQSIVLEAGQQISGLKLPLRKGGSISGTIASANRPELPGVSVSLTRCVGLEVCDAAHAQRVQSATTDDRGAYRFFGLAGGAYFISVDSRLGGGSSMPVAIPSPEDMRAAKAQLAAGSNANTPLPPASDPRPVTSLTTYFPGTTDAERAQPVEIDDGEDRVGVNIASQIGSAATISGMVLGQDGQPIEARLSIFPNQRGLAMAGSTMVAWNGKTFVARGLPPGAYRIAGRVGTDLSVAETFSVNGQDVTGVTMRLRQTIEVSGRVVFDAQGVAATPDLAGVTVSLRRADLAVTVSTLDINSATPDQSGAFVIKGVMPGRYVVTCTIPSRPGTTLWLKSASVGGRDAIDTPVEITSSETPPITVTLTTRSAEIAGSVRDASGRPAPAYTVMAFPADPALWVQGSRRILSSPVSADGSFALKGAPAGDYLLGLVGTNNLDDVDRAVLTELSRTAMRVAIAEGETKRVDLQVGAGRSENARR